MLSMRRRRLLAGAAAGLLLALGCAREEVTARPNLLFIVWDTVRADRMSLYGHTQPTTPGLERWAARGRVYDAMAPSCWTIPSHASMFTGLLPSEHSLNTRDAALDPNQQTLAGRLLGAGYETYAFSANPHISVRTGLTRGFGRVEHPFDEHLRARAQQIVRARIAPEESNVEARKRVEGRGNWGFTASGELVNERFFAFVDSRSESGPFFAFLNYMDAHRTRLPSRASRSRVMAPDQIGRSYSLDQSQDRFQRVTLGLDPPFPPHANEVIRAVYDASLVELDGFLDALLQGLEERGLLSETVVVLTSDHGEHLGEHGSYLHQFSLHEALTRVPLVVWAPHRLAAGREDIPVSAADVFPTLLEFAGLEIPEGLSVRSLLRPDPSRAVIAEYPDPYAPMLAKYPELDPTPFLVRLEALRLGRHKVLRGSDGRLALFDLVDDPEEARDLAETSHERAEDLRMRLDAWHQVRRPPLRSESLEQAVDEDEAERLRALGYL